MNSYEVVVLSLHLESEVVHHKMLNVKELYVTAII